MTNWFITYSETKRAIGDYLVASEALLHVHAGLLIFCFSSLLLRRRMRSMVPIGLVYAFAIVNELADIFTPDKHVGFSALILDVLNTVFWPTLLFLLARRRTSRA